MQHLKSPPINLLHLCMVASGSKYSFWMTYSTWNTFYDSFLILPDSCIFHHKRLTWKKIDPSSSKSCRKCSYRKMTLMDWQKWRYIVILAQRFCCFGSSSSHEPTKPWTSIFLWLFDNKIKFWLAQRWNWKRTQIEVSKTFSVDQLWFRNLWRRKNFDELLDLESFDSLNIF